MKRVLLIILLLTLACGCAKKADPSGSSSDQKSVRIASESGSASVAFIDEDLHTSLGWMKGRQTFSTGDIIAISGTLYDVIGTFRVLKMVQPQIGDKLAEYEQPDFMTVLVRKRPNEANQALVPTPTSVTAPAGQEPRQP